jgi:hypothetical protein
LIPVPPWFIAQVAIIAALPGIPSLRWLMQWRHNYCCHSNIFSLVSMASYLYSVFYLHCTRPAFFVMWELWIMYVTFITLGRWTGCWTGCWIVTFPTWLEVYLPVV